jgi:hypothetical protein
MRVWQLYLDESGNFEAPNDAVLVAGVLFEGRATPQVSSALRRRLEEIFVGSPYPPHAAHHNVATSLLGGALAGHAPHGPASERFLRGIAGALHVARGDNPHSRTLRAAVARADRPQRVDLGALQTFDRWLRRTAPAAHTALIQERDLQRADLKRYAAEDLPKQLGRPPLLLAAWQANAGPLTDADARYEQLYETLVERALSFIARRDDGAQLDVHLAVRHRTVPQEHVEKLKLAEEHASAFALLARAKRRPAIVRYKAETYHHGVAPGIVLADFAANTLYNAPVSAASWSQLAADLQGRLGLPASAGCALLPLATALPAVAADGPAREAVRRAADGSTPAASAPAPSLAGEPRWAKEQAHAWIAALHGEATR